MGGRTRERDRPELAGDEDYCYAVCLQGGEGVGEERLALALVDGPWWSGLSSTNRSGPPASAWLMRDCGCWRLESWATLLASCNWSA